MTTFTREDFEHAARAARVPKQLWDLEWCRANGHMVTPSMMWNPPDNDGEALRLAVKLPLHILHNDPGEPVLWVSAVLNKRGLHGVAEFQDEAQRTEATRHAIFRAAIAIGKAMPAPEQRPKADDCSASPGVAVPEQQTASLYHPNWIAKP